MDNYSSKNHQIQPDFRDFDILYKQQTNIKSSSNKKKSFFGVPTVESTSTIDKGIPQRSNSLESNDSNISSAVDDNTRRPSITQMFTGFFKSSVDSDLDRKISLDDYMNTRRKESINGDGFSRQDYMTKNLVDSLKIGKPKF
ncbi:Hypothetical protein SRAE_2000387700 [Strongyloides ratti]|uniref:Uncharacterized protein n=1 Tax=Strongyloides ratti TaxID=34506 RepID=A0A090LHN2_STRRB|nr:Hypothetical protein SRAE_2000387700 [Strongyloides ratti]CEF69227.1 Hypothetical protein SRAE_2000387700 [Strongyloides ratti]